LCLEDARAKIEAWRAGYNKDHPHSALGYLTPGEFAATKVRGQRPKTPPKLSL